MGIVTCSFCFAFIGPGFCQSCCTDACCRKSGCSRSSIPFPKRPDLSGGTRNCSDGDGRGPRTRIHQKWIYSYYGIPYAEATHRFEAAKPVKPWRGIRMATQVGPISPQAQGNFPNGEWGEPGRSFTMDNNCLNLNVWTPTSRMGKSAPSWFGSMRRF